MARKDEPEAQPGHGDPKGAPEPTEKLTPPEAGEPCPLCGVIASTAGPKCAHCKAQPMQPTRDGMHTCQCRRQLTPKGERTVAARKGRRNRR